MGSIFSGLTTNTLASGNPMFPGGAGAQPGINPFAVQWNPDVINKLLGHYGVQVNQQLPQHPLLPGITTGKGLLGGWLHAHQAIGSGIENALLGIMNTPAGPNVQGAGEGLSRAVMGAAQIPQYKQSIAMQSFMAPFMGANLASGLAGREAMNTFYKGYGAAASNRSQAAINTAQANVIRAQEGRPYVAPNGTAYTYNHATGGWAPTGYTPNRTTSYFQDAKGNYYYTNPVTGKEVALPPGQRPMERASNPNIWDVLAKDYPNNPKAMLAAYYRMQGGLAGVRATAGANARKVVNPKLSPSQAAALHALNTWYAKSLVGQGGSSTVRYNGHTYFAGEKGFTSAANAVNTAAYRQFLAEKHAILHGNGRKSKPSAAPSISPSPLFGGNLLQHPAGTPSTPFPIPLGNSNSADPLSIF